MIGIFPKEPDFRLFYFLLYLLTINIFLCIIYEVKMIPAVENKKGGGRETKNGRNKS